MRIAPYLALFSGLVVSACATSNGTGGSDSGDVVTFHDDTGVVNRHDARSDVSVHDAHPEAAKGDAGHDAFVPDVHADTGHDAPIADAPTDVVKDTGEDVQHVDVNVVPSDAAITDPCSLPGTVQFTAAGRVVVDGGAPDSGPLAFLTLPTGFCAHYYATVGNVRKMRFAPGGELFAASPTALSTGGNPTGAYGAIVVLPDDNHDGVADETIVFEQFTRTVGMGTTSQGMLFTPGYFYFQDGNPPGTDILRIPYAAGQRATNAVPEQLADLTQYFSQLHWPKAMDIADDGTIYVGNGGDQGQVCVQPEPFTGGILSVDAVPDGGHPSGQDVARGFRNPIDVRCWRGHGTCFALELAKDYTGDQGGREKMVPIVQGEDYGFPCCATTNLPYTESADAGCGSVTPETNSFIIGDTPFGLDFSPTTWPGSWGGTAFVANHGQAGSWTGARVLAIPMDAVSGLPMPTSDTEGGVNQGMTNFATGWDDGFMDHGRPAAVAFSPDGRLFVGNDYNGMIFWVAPMQGVDAGTDSGM